MVFHGVSEVRDAWWRSNGELCSRLGSRRAIRKESLANHNHDALHIQKILRIHFRELFLSIVVLSSRVARERLQPFHTSIQEQISSA